MTVSKFEIMRNELCKLRALTFRLQERVGKMRKQSETFFKEICEGLDSHQREIERNIARLEKTFDRKFSSDYRVYKYSKEDLENANI